MPRTVRNLVALAVLVPLAYAGWNASWQWFINSHHLSFVPSAMGVQRVLYVSEESWGLGPGGNETGIIVYEMPATIAADLSRRGLVYLNELSSQATAREWRGRYSDWQLTPIEIKGVWRPTEAVPTSSPIRDYLGRYGFAIPVRSDVEHLTNGALLNAGSFYARGRTGVIILVPSQKRIIYAYRG